MTRTRPRVVRRPKKAPPRPRRAAPADPLLARVRNSLHASSAYHVPTPPVITAKLDANELPFALPADLRARLGAALAEVPLERYPDPRARELRASIAAKLGVAGDQLVFGNGSDELIAMLVSVFAKGGVFYPTPSFVYYYLAAIARDVPAHEFATNDRFEIDEAKLVAAIKTKRPGVVFLALPNNPTGTLWRMELALELAARFRDVVIVSDEAYVAYSGKTLLPHLAEHQNLVIMRTLSKIGMAGLRVGFTISSPKIAGFLERVRPPYNISALDQRAARFLIDEAWAWCEARAADVVVERERLARSLVELGVEVFPSEANLLLCRFGDRVNEVWQHLADVGISVRSFGTAPSRLEGCVRITVGTPEENERLVERLATLLGA